MKTIVIAKEAERIKEEIKDGRIYGETINLNNPDVVIVAAYYLGRAEQSKDKMEWYERTPARI